MGIDNFEFKGEGMARVYENNKWTVGIKNYKPANDIANIDCIERHNETDELFVLLDGSCILVYAYEKSGVLVFSAVKMEKNKVYSIPQSLWHNTITSQDTKMILIEDSSTGMVNSDVLNLSPEQIDALKTAANSK
jgi:mannose-6-phosphate isomerase-like protein (cupin superfamily)